MRYRLIVPNDFTLPGDRGHLAVLVKGAMAFQDGKPVYANPYEIETFFKAWRRGWEAARAGIIILEVQDTRHRVYGREIIRSGPL